MPNENKSGEKHGYESAEFTSDGGFIAGGFVKRFGNIRQRQHGPLFVVKLIMDPSIVIVIKEVQFHQCKFSMTMELKKLSLS